MGRRSKNAERCGRCRMHLERCICSAIPRIPSETRIALVMHHREQHKTTATGPLALAALPNSELSIHGLRDAPLDLTHLLDQARRPLLLFPSEEARPLDDTLKAEDPRPVTLVVPDGSWRQAGRVPKRVPGLAGIQHVTLPAGEPSRWGVRREPNARGLATFEAIARAMGILESAEVEQRLTELFARMVRETFAARGYDVADVPEEALADLPVLYRDRSIVAVNKPSGLPVHRGWAHDGVPALQRVRDQIGEFLYPVHRLDRGTSGVLLFALKSEVARDLQGLFTEGLVQKRYLALCRGRSPTLRRVEHPLSSDNRPEPRGAVTEFRLLGSFERYGLYEAMPRTGRTHQIRRHLKHVSHPIIGDVRYGKGEHNRIFRDRFGFHRMALHCQRLSFEHPRSGVPVEIQAPLTEDFSALLQQLGLLRGV